MRKLMTGVVAFVLAVSTTAAAQTADEKNTARDFGIEGQKALDHGDARTAEDRFHRAVEIFDAAKAPVPPTLLLGYARGAAKNNHVIAAAEAYNRIIRAGLPPGAPAPFVKALDDAKKEIDAVSARIARVTISVSGCDHPTVTLDGAPVPSFVLGVKKPVDPGTHEVKATAQGCKDATASFTVADGKEATSALTLQKEAATATTTTPTTTTPTTTTTTPTTTTAPPPGAETGSSGGGSGLKIAGFVTLAVGGAGLVVGAIAGGIAIGDHSTLVDNGCANGVCPPSQASELDSFRTMGTLSTIGFIAGGVLAAAGLVMVILAPSSSKKEHAWVAPVIGPTGVGMVGRF
jgi:hypothetical protein